MRPKSLAESIDNRLTDVASSSNSGEEPRQASSLTGLLVTYQTKVRARISTDDHHAEIARGFEVSEVSLPIPSKIRRGFVVAVVITAIITSIVKSVGVKAPTS